MANEEHSPFDLVVAVNVAAKAEHLLTEAARLATSLGTSITLGQVIAAVLTSGWHMSEEQMTRDEFAGIYDYVEALQARFAQAAGLQGEAVATVTKGTGSPADTANAASAEEAADLTAKWAERVNDVAFGSITQEDLGG